LLNCAQDGGDWPTPRPGHSSTGKDAWYPLNMKASPEFWTTEKSLAPAGIRTLDRPARRLVTMPTVLTQIK